MELLRCFETVLHGIVIRCDPECKHNSLTINKLGFRIIDKWCDRKLDQEQWWDILERCADSDKGAEINHCYFTEHDEICTDTWLIMVESELLKFKIMYRKIQHKVQRMDTGVA